MTIVLFDRELEVMQVLWENGPSTVPEVRSRLADEMAYNTVLTVLTRLEAKGFVTHEEDGRAYRFHAAIEEMEVKESAIDQLTRKLFKSSSEGLLAHLVSDKLSKAQLRRVKDLLEEKLSQRPK